MTPEEREHLLPRVLGLRGAVAVGVHEVQERVTGALVAMELVRLAVARELGGDLVDIGGRGLVIVQPEEAGHGRRYGPGVIAGRRLLAPRLHDVAALDYDARPPSQRSRPRAKI